MPIFKCPENYAKADFINNQAKIKQLLDVRKSTEAKKRTKSAKIRKFLKKIKYSIKDFFRNFSKIVKIIFTNKNKNTVYIAFVCYAGFGDFMRYKSVLQELIKMYPNLVIDIYSKAACQFKEYKILFKYRRYQYD